MYDLGSLPLRPISEDAEDLIPLSAAGVNQSLAKRDLRGASQCSPQVLSFAPIFTEDIIYAIKIVLVIASYMPQISPVSP